jgi:hypothetical protein
VSLGAWAHSGSEFEVEVGVGVCKVCERSAADWQLSVVDKRVSSCSNRFKNWRGGPMFRVRLVPAPQAGLYVAKTAFAALYVYCW